MDELYTGRCFGEQFAQRPLKKYHVLLDASLHSTLCMRP